LDVTVKAAAGIHGTCLWHARVDVLQTLAWHKLCLSICFVWGCVGTNLSLVGPVPEAITLGPRLALCVFLCLAHLRLLSLLQALAVAYTGSGLFWFWYSMHVA
jgi:hypothetical protein